MTEMAEISSNETPKQKRNPFEIFSIADIPEAESVSWIIESLVPVGLTMLGGRSKAGKSWLALQIARAVSSGDPFLDRFNVQQGNTLYLALEDNTARLKSRAERLQAGDITPLYCATGWPKFDDTDNGVERLRKWFETSEDNRLCIIDVWQKVRPARRGIRDDYQVVYEELSVLVDMAREFNAGIILVHHLKKNNYNEAESQDSLLGTVAIPGVSDSILLLTRKTGENKAELSVQGRDAQDATLKLHFNEGLFSLTEEQHAAITSENEQKIIQALSTPRTLTEVSNLTSIGKSTAQSALSRMVEKGVINKNGKNKGATYSTNTSIPIRYIQ